MGNPVGHETRVADMLDTNTPAEIDAILQEEPELIPVFQKMADQRAVDNAVPVDELNLENTIPVEEPVSVDEFTEQEKTEKYWAEQEQEIQRQKVEKLKKSLTALSKKENKTAATNKRIKDITRRLEAGGVNVTGFLNQQTIDQTDMEGQQIEEPDGEEIIVRQELEDTLTKGNRKEENLIFRELIDNMSPEDMKVAIASLRSTVLVDELTQLGSLKAYHLSDKKPVQSMVDVDSLKWVNDNHGHESGNELLALMGEAFKGNSDAFHISGDEFVIQGNNKKDIDKSG